MNIMCVVSIFPQVRGVKVAGSFEKRGHSVFIISVNRREKTFDDVWKTNVRHLNFRPIIEKLPPYSIVSNKIIKYVIKSKFYPDIIYTNSIFVSPMAIDVSKKLGCPLIADILDNIPEVFLEILNNRFLGYLAYKYFNSIEYKTLIYSSIVLCVSNFSKKHLLMKHQIEDDKILVVPNYPTAENIKKINDIVSRYFHEKVYDAIYVGDISSTKVRDIDAVVKGVKKIYEKYGRNVKIRVATFQPEVFKKVALRYLSENELRNFFVLTGPIELSKMYTEIVRSKVGLVPHKRGGMTDYTVPNKIWDYIHCGIHILVSDNPSLIHVIKDYPNSSVYVSGDEESFAEKLVKAIESEHRDYRAYGLKKFVWDDIFELVEKRIVQLTSIRKNDTKY